MFIKEAKLGKPIFFLVVHIIFSIREPNGVSSIVGGGGNALNHSLRAAKQMGSQYSLSI